MATDKLKIDSHKLIYHPRHVVALMDAEDSWEVAKKIYPIYMEISPSGSCNHRCIFCSVDYVGYKRESLSLDTLQRLLPELGRLGVKSVMYAGEGEPLLHNQINEIVCLTKSAGIDVSFTTNASVLPKDFVTLALPHVSWLKASINAGTAETYGRVHGVKPQMFDKVVANLKAMAAAKREAGLDVTLGAQIVLLPENAHEIETLALICRDEIGLDYLVVKPYTQSESSSNRTYESIDYTNYAKQGNSFDHISTDTFRVVYRDNTMAKYNSSERYSRCHAVPFLWGYVMADGTLTTCSAYLLDPRFELGNVNEKGFQELWESEKRKQIWTMMKPGFDISGCRKNCRMDEVNRYLYSLIDAPPPHVNFI